MAQAAATLVRRLYDEGRCHGVLAAGGSGNTAIATAAMQALPFQAATKAALGFRGVGVRGVVRPPLRTLHEDEIAVVERLVREWDA